MSDNNKIVLSKLNFRKIFNKSKSPIEYTSYKYQHIQTEWIIHQSHLKYLYNTKIRGDSQFETYLIVLTRIPIETFEYKIVLYLYSNENKSPSYFFEIDQTTQIYDRCNRIIEPAPKYFLFELKFINQENQTEIFGAKDNFERQIWVRILKNIFPKSKSKTLPVDYLYLLPTPSENEQYLSCPTAPSDFEVSSSSKAEQIEHTQSSINENKNHQLSGIELCSNDNSNPFQEKRLMWNSIFYRNKNNDYPSILARTNEYGAFLIRPQSKKSSTSNHDYTLCLYYQSNDIRCFPIYQLSTRKNEYSLAQKDSKNFVDMIHLCEYYRINPLPMSTNNNVYLKNPYKYFINEYNFIE
ncbi:unnamed protein product [Rotaria sp. Silwood1]|nr:unnamed protein product [Rotaria sp. Silwood1]